MVKCRICLKDFQAITNTHVKKLHNISLLKYKEMYPEDIIGAYNKSILGEKLFNEIEEKRRKKISIHSNLEGCRNGQKAAIKAKIKNGTTKWKSDAIGRKSIKYKGRTPWNKGLTKYNNEIIKKYSDKRRKYPEGIDFRLYGWDQDRAMEIRKRDNFTCQKCGKKRSSIVHHRNGDRRVNTDENLVTVCRRCHQEIHMEKDISGRFIYRETPLLFWK